MNIEPLESRIAPATLVNPTTVTYTDLDGDAVTVKTSAGAFVLTVNIAFGPPTPAGGEQLVQIFLAGASGLGFDGANLTVSVVKKPGGDGLANVGEIISDRDLGAVTIKGDLGRISAGDGTTLNDPGLKSLSVQTLGRFGTATGGSPNGDGTLESHIVGALGALKVTGDVANAWLHVTGNGAGDEANGKIGSVSIGGSLLGGATLRAGAIEASGDVGAVKIGRDLVGGAGVAAGFVQSERGTIKSVTLGGSLLGGLAQFTGAIRGGSDLGPVKIGGDVRGGAGAESGVIASDTGFGVDNGDIASVTIGGSLAGGGGAGSGVIRSSVDLGPVKIGRDIRGSEGDEAGKIDVLGNFKSLTVGGSIVADSGDFNSGPVARFGQIVAQGTIGSVTVRGSLLGGIDINGPATFGGGGHGAEIVAQGDIGAVKIGGDLHGTVFFSARVQSVNGGIASVTVGGSLIGGTDPVPTDAFIGGSRSGAIEASGDIGFVKIGRDVIGGSAIETGRITADSIKTVTIGGSLIGGTTSNAGQLATGELGAVKIGGNLVGGSISGTMSSRSGMGSILGFDSIGSVFIGGSIITGFDTSTGGDLTLSGTIVAQDDIGSLIIKGSVIGHAGTGAGATLAIISARGQDSQSPKLTATSDVAIGKISIGGSVEFARILAGYSPFSIPSGAVNADAQIGSVSVGGNWITSSLVAGASNIGNPNFGNASDVKISGAGTKDTSDATLISKIASITIKGVVLGTLGGTDHFGFVAQQIGKFKAAGFTAPLTAGPPNNVIELSPITGDVTIREI